MKLKKGLKLYQAHTENFYDDENQIIEPMITIGFRPDWEHHPKYTKTINGSKITLKKSSITPIRGREKKPQKPIHITHHPRQAGKTQSQKKAFADLAANIHTCQKYPINAPKPPSL